VSLFANKGFFLLKNRYQKQDVDYKREEKMGLFPSQFQILMAEIMGA